MDPLDLIKEGLKQVEGLSARAVLNYVLYEFELGGPSREVVEEAVRIAQKEIAELQKTLEILKRLEVYV